MVKVKLKKPRDGAGFSLHKSHIYTEGFAAVHNSGRYWAGSKKIRKMGEWLIRAADFIDQEKVAKRTKV